MAVALTLRPVSWMKSSGASAADSQGFAALQLRRATLANIFGIVLGGTMSVIIQPTLVLIENHCVIVTVTF